MKYCNPLGLISSLFLCVFIFDAEAQTQQIEPTYISISEGLASPTVSDVLQDSYGLIWIATNNGLQKYDGYMFETFKNVPGKPTSLQSNISWGIAEDASHNIWVGTELGASRYDRQKNEFTNYLFSRSFNTAVDGGRTFKIIVDSQKRIWAVTLNLELVEYDVAADVWKYSIYEVPGVEQPVHTGLSIAFTEDLKGGLWFGSTTYGLMHRAKNESTFKPITSGQLGGLNFSKSKNTITSLFADSTNTLWITTRNGLYKYNPDHGNFKTIKEYSEAQIEILNHWNSILPDREGNVWIANNFRGILKFEGISDQFEEVSIAGRLKMLGHGWNITFTDFMIDRSGIFWFGTREYGLLKYDPVNKPFSTLAHDDANPNSISPNGVYGILASKVKPGIVYVGTRGEGLNIFNPKKQIFEKVTFKVVDDVFRGSVRSIAENSDGTLWLGTWGDGLIKLDQNYREVIRYKYEPKLTSTISNNQVRVIKPDKQGRLWVGTNNGLNIFNPQSANFQRLISKSTRSYPIELVKEIEKLINSDQKIGIIDQVDDSQNRSLPIEIKVAGTYFVMSVGEGDANSMADFGWIENTAKDTVWQFGDFDQSFYAGGAAKNRIVIRPISLQPGTYTLRYKTDDSHSFGLWNEAAPDQTSLYGIALIKPLNEDQVQSFQTLLGQNQQELIISGNNILDIEVGEKYVWVSANGEGLSRIDPATNAVKYYNYNPDNQNSLSSNTISDIYEDSRGVIWLATNEGINKFDPNTEQFTRYSETDGLPTNLIVAILEGDNSEMWVATQNGLAQMVTNEALGKVTFINYNSTDGLGGDIFLSLSAARATDGRFYFGGEHGLTTFSSIAANSVPPDLIISNLLISNKSVRDMGDDSPLTTNFLSTEDLKLSSEQNNLSFEFAALHFANSEKNQYAHILKGYDKDWIYDNRNFASYTNLDPGEYEFAIRASNAYGIWNEKGKSLRITILPPWWRTWWAYALYASLFAAGIFAIDRIMRRRIKLKERERTREKELKHAKEIEKAYTNLKETQTQLIQSEKMASLGELTAGIAHEIQNPLNFVNNFSEVNSELIAEMKEELAKGNIAEAKTIATHIDENEKKIIFHGKRADGIVKGMLQHSRSSSGVKEPTDINVLADEYLRLAYHGLRAKDKSFNASMKTEFDESLGNVTVVPQDIGRVILNLITNAFYAVTERKKQNGEGFEPTVTVITRKAGNKVEITVKDNGHGIPQKTLDKIFQPFFTTKPTGQGTGLGLSMSYDIVTNTHQGEIKVKTKEGEGTEFIVVLPL